MRNVLALLLLLLSCAAITLTSCSCASGSRSDGVDHRSESAPAADLRAELRNVSVLKHNFIELDFVLINSSGDPIQLVERWNSWGAYQWTFNLIDANGSLYILRNPQADWWANFFSTFTILPAKEFVMRCRLVMTTQAFSDGPVFVFTRGLGSEYQNNAWHVPVTVTGTFTATKHEKTEWQAGTNWAGTIVTAPIRVEMPPNNVIKAN